MILSQSKMGRRSFLGAAAATAGGPLLRSQSAADAVSEQDTKTLGRGEHTKFSLNIEMWWTKLPLLERIDRAADLGFPAVEFWEWREKDIDAIASKTQARGIEVSNITGWGFTPGLNNPVNHDRFVAEIEAGCQVAKKLNAPLMTVVGGDDQPGMTQDEMHRHIITGLRRAAPIAERHQVMLALESMNIRVDHKGHCLYGSPPAVRICREVDSPFVKINWDFYHMQISEGDLCGRLREGWEQVGYLQLADHPGRNEPGTGEIHYNRVLREAYELGYRGYVGLECAPRGDEVEAARAVARADIW
jgi:hydroxypyruvate isomerase